MAHPNQYVEVPMNSTYDQMRISARVQLQYYEFNPHWVEEQLSKTLRNKADQPLLHAIFESPEWKSQCAPVPDEFFRQLRHQLELQSGVVYACPFCTVTEYEANHMTEHIQEHFGLKPYPCPEWYVANPS